MTFASVTQHLSRLSSNEYEERENENSLCFVDVLELAGCGKRMVSMHAEIFNMRACTVQDTMFSSLILHTGHGK